MSLLHAEFRKLSRRKLFPVMSGILGLLMLFVGLIFFLVIPAIPDLAGDSPIPERPEAFLFGAQQVAGQAWWFAVILVTAVFGAELGSTVWATSLSRDSRKWLHIIARLLMFSAASGLAFLFGTAAWAVITWIAAEGSGQLPLSDWLGLIWRFALIAAAWSSIGLGAVALARSIGPAMGVALGFSFLDSIVAPFFSPYETVSITAASNGIFDVGGDSAFSIFIPGGDFTTLHAVLVMLGWIALGLGLTWWGLQRRDA